MRCLWFLYTTIDQIFIIKLLYIFNITTGPLLQYKLLITRNHIRYLMIFSPRQFTISRIHLQFTQLLLHVKHIILFTSFFVFFTSFFILFTVFIIFILFNYFLLFIHYFLIIIHLLFILGPFFIGNCNIILIRSRHFLTY
jgi:hypothetical protein